MKSSIIKRSVVIAGHKTSVSLEDAFWSGLKQIRVPSKRRCRKPSQRSTRRANGATFPPRSVCSYSTVYAHLRQTALMLL